MGKVTKVLAAGAGVAALGAGGVALADASSGGTQVVPAAGQAGAQHGARGRGMRMALGVRPGRLTHGDLTVFVNGHDVQVRVDRGVLKSVTGNSIVLHELDGSDVTIPVDSSTRVIKMRRPATLSDLRVGDVAFAARVQGKPARLVRSPGHPPHPGRRASQ